VPDFNTVLCTHTHTHTRARARFYSLDIKARHYSTRTREKQLQKYLKLVAPANLVFMVLICKLPLWYREITRCKIGTSRRIFFCCYYYYFFLSFADRASWYICIIWTNRIHYFILIYFNNKSLHVSSRLAAHHQEDQLCTVMRYVYREMILLMRSTPARNIYRLNIEIN